MMVHICPNINANVKNFIILVLFYGVYMFILYFILYILYML